MVTSEKVKTAKKVASFADVIKLNYTRREAAFALGVSLRTVDYLIAKGDLRTTRIASKVLVPVGVLKRYAASDHPESFKA